MNNKIIKIISEKLKKYNLSGNHIYYTVALGSGYHFEKEYLNEKKSFIIVFIDSKNHNDQIRKFNFKKILFIKLDIPTYNYYKVSRLIKFSGGKIFHNFKYYTYFDAKYFPKNNVKYRLKNYHILTQNFHENSLFSYYKYLVNKKVISKYDLNYKKYINQLKKIKYPNNYFISNNCIFHVKNNKQTKEIFKKVLQIAISKKISRNMLILPYVIWKKKQRKNIFLTEAIKDFHKLNVSRVKLNLFNKTILRIDRSWFVWRVFNKFLKFVDKNMV